MQKKTEAIRLMETDGKKRSERKKKKQISSGDWEMEASLNRVREQKRADKVKGNDIEAVESQKGQCKCALKRQVGERKGQVREMERAAQERVTTK